MTDATQEQRLTDTDCYVRAAAVALGGLTAKQHKRALRDTDWVVRAEAVRLGGLTPAQHERALRDEHWYVREAARALEVADVRAEIRETLGIRDAETYGEHNRRLIGAIHAALEVTPRSPSFPLAERIFVSAGQDAVLCALRDSLRGGA